MHSLDSCIAFEDTETGIIAPKLESVQRRAAEAGHLGNIECALHECLIQVGEPALMFSVIVDQAAASKAKWKMLSLVAYFDTCMLLDIGNHPLSQVLLVCALQHASPLGVTSSHKFTVSLSIFTPVCV